MPVADTPVSYDIYGIGQVVQFQELGNTHSIAIEHAARAMEVHAMNALDEFVSIIRELPFVERVVAKHRGGGLWVTTYVNGSDEAGRFEIYDAEDEIEARYESIEFDFHVVDRKGQPLDFGGSSSETIVNQIRELAS